MIQSKLVTGQKVITSDVFPEICTCRMVTNDTVRTTYCNTPIMQSRMSEKRIGRFMLMNQKSRSFDDCMFEVHRSGSPVLMLSLANECDMIRSRHSDRLWMSGDVCLSMSNQEDIVRNYAKKDKRLNITNVIIPETAVHQLAEINPDAMGRFCLDFEKGVSMEYGQSNIHVNRRLASIFRSIESCNDMGNYAENYMESKIMDGLTEYFNIISDEPKQSLKYNFVIRSKMMDARKIMEEHYQDPPSLAELAIMVGTNVFTLKKAFKQCFGISVFQYLFDYRMDMAIHYLLDTNRPISVIGHELGFCNHTHFCIAFRRKFGTSPTSFRENRFFV